ncbi:MAG: hypothetical protein V8T90_03495 [Victivallales bacterium]
MEFSIRNKLFFLLAVIPAFAGAQNKIPEKDTNSYLRMDINAIPGRIVLRGQKQTDAHIYNAGWYREDSPFVLTMAAKEPLKQEWTEYSVTFVPNRSGKVWIRIGGRWSKEGEERTWLMVDSVRLNGKLLENGDFKEYSERQPDVFRPENWILQHRAEFYIDGGQDKSPACLVNHDSPIVTSFQVRAGEPNTVSVVVKQPRRGIIPKYIPPKKIQNRYDKRNF